jgi:hypothetical protein
MNPMTTEVPPVARGLSRRQILLGGAGAVVAAGVGLSLAGPGRGLLDVLPFVGGGAHQPLDRTPMSERIGETFTTRDGEGTRITLTLSAVDDLPAPAETHNLEGQFVARFRGPRDSPLPQDTYRFGTASFGDVDVFVVPGAADELGIDYSAVFNRMQSEVMP